MALRTLVARSGTFTLVASSVATLLAPACLNRPIDRLEPRTTATVYGVIPSSAVDKIDIVLVIDNSSSMADKQTILAKAVPDLVDRFVNPLCILDGAPIPEADQPGSPIDPCPGDSRREFPPIVDIHVGIISSSLGAFGGFGCDTATTNDAGHLLSRVSSGSAQTYQGMGFLAWDPTMKLDPAGETDKAALQSSLTAMVEGVGQVGCGYEMPLEAAYRFLVDPAPYASLEHDGSTGPNRRVGLDQDLLDQRAAFLRPDSLVALIVLSDENDCSMQAEGQAWLTMRAQPFARSSSACEGDPNDPCCYSCDPKVKVPEGCQPDPICQNPVYTDGEDPTNLRCWDQKRRYGHDFLYPTKRYVNAFTQPKIDPESIDLGVSDGEGMDNPLVAGRPPGLVYFAGIVGVPWQAVARRDAGGTPDLSLGFKTPAELEKDGSFAKLVGDPSKYQPPTDPFTIESRAPRSGQSDLVGATLPGPNPVNGFEHSENAQLQFTCIIDIDDVPNASDCSGCTGPDCQSPLCDGTTQTHAKAFPGLRQMDVVRGMGDQGVVASVCPAILDDADDSAYGYRPAVSSIVDALKVNLANVQCLPFTLRPDDRTGDVTCVVIEASKDDACSCDAPGFQPVEDVHRAAAERILEDPFHDPAQGCLCEISQLGGDARTTCQNELDAPAGVDGWCYVDATVQPPVGNPSLVGDCSSQEKRVVRFVGGAEATPGTTRYVTCLSELGAE